MSKHDSKLDKHSLKSRVSELGTQPIHDDLVGGPRAEQLLQEVTQALSETTGEAFFRELVHILTKALQVDYAFVGELDKNDAHTIHSRAVCHQGKIIENFTYDLRGTPCEHVVGKDFCIYTADVQRQFPNAPLLVEMDIESYMGAPLFNPAGQPIGLLALLHGKPLHDYGHAETILKITAPRAAAELERQHNEAALRESEKRFRSVVENAPVCIHTIDLQGRITSMNSIGLHMLGLEKEDQVCGMEMLAVVNDADRARIRELLQKAFKGEPSHFEFTTSNDRIFSSSFIPVKNAEGRVEYLMGVTEDITERRQAVETLRKSEYALRMLHEIIANQGLSFEEKIQALLSLGCQQFGLPIGILSHIVGDRYEIIEVVAPDKTIAKGSVFALGQTYCNETMKVNEPVGFEHASKSEWGTHPAYREFRLEAYLGITVTVKGQPYGTLNFSSPEPCKQAFTPTDKEILRSMAQWTGSELERKQAETLSARLGRILDHSPNEIYVLDAESLRFVQVNQSARRNLGYTMEELKNLTPLDLKPEFDQEYFEALLEPLRRGEQEVVSFVTSHKRKDGSLYPVEIRLQLTRDENAPVFVAIIQDITERKHAEERLSFLAYHDALTGLPNRTLLNDRLRHAMHEADRYERLVAVMFLDLDRFKVINDTLGHNIGDALLKAVAERLTSCVRAGDTVARLSGDEFTMVLANVAHIDDVTRVATKILDRFVSPFHVGGRELFVTASLGITLYPFDDNSLDNLLKNADIAMYHAKEQGRNTFQYYTAELNVRAERRLALETALRKAQEKNELLLHYQPQVDLKTGRITGMEALLRWKHPDLGMIQPGEFIPLAEETGLIVPIGEWVLQTACAQTKTWQKAGFPALRIAVNLSGRQLLQKDLPEVVERALRESGLEARYLDLELTESLLMQDIEETISVMKELDKVGVLFSLDDFGTGYSSLSYLKRFPIDTLKIDQAFVSEITTDSDDAAITKAIIAMAHGLGIHVIAEGVETREQAEFLRANRCDGMQGYYFSKPVPAETFTDLLQEGRKLDLEKRHPRKRAVVRRKG